MATIVRLQSGSWRAQVMRGGVRKGSTFKKHADARRWAAEMETKLESVKAFGVAQPPKGSTVADFIDKYVDETDPVKPHGRNKKATLKRLQKEFKNVQMSEFSTMHLRDFVEKRAKEKTQAGTPISGVTIAVDLSYISILLKWAKTVKHYDVDIYMVKEARSMLGLMGLSTVSNEREREASKEELVAIFEAYSKKDRQKIPMIDLITFAVASAMRQEEICSLNISDVDFAERTVIVRSRKDPRKKIGNHMIVPLLGKAWEIVEKYIGNRKEGNPPPFNHRSVGTSFGRVRDECQIDDLHFHDLRHTAIGLLFELQLTIPEVAHVSGHKDWKNLKRYTHIKSKNVHESFEENMERRKRREKTLDILT